ncbi:hypothetical protein HPB47_002145, partial [Ixodes persulcatus]
VQTFFPYTNAACQTSQWKPKEAHPEDSCDELGKPDASREDPGAEHDNDYVPSEEYRESVHSNYCKLCTLGPKPGTEGYTEWMEDHRPMRKIAMMQRKAPAKCFKPNEADDPEKQLGLTKGEELDGYRLLGVSCIEALSKALKAAGEPPAFWPHKPAFSKEIAREMVPLYNLLSQRDLLERCSRMKTQNSNDSFNTLVWKRCPQALLLPIRGISPYKQLQEDLCKVQEWSVINRLPLKTAKCSVMLVTTTRQPLLQT